MIMSQVSRLTKLALKVIQISRAPVHSRKMRKEFGQFCKCTLLASLFSAAWLFL